MKHSRVSLTQVTALLVSSSLAASQAGCVVSSTEIVNTDRVYLLGPKTESEPGPATRDVTMKAVDTKGTIAFHLDRARECTVTSTPRFQRVHIEGKQAKNLTGGIITGTVLTAIAAGLIASSFVVDSSWTTEGSTSDNASFTGAGYLGLTGIIVGISALFVLPRGIYHAAVSGTTITPRDIEYGTPPPGALRAPSNYDPKNPDVKASLPGSPFVALGPLAAPSGSPRYDVMAFGASPAGEIKAIPSLVPTAASPWKAAPSDAEPVTSLRSERDFEEAVKGSDAPASPALLGIPQSSGGGSDPMRACVQKYTPACQAKCGTDKGCVLTCLRKPCVDNLEKETEPGSEDPRDEYTTVITKTEMCERAADSGTGLALIVKDVDGVPKTIDLGKTDKSGDVKKNVLAGLESAYPGWPDVKQALLPEAQVILVEDPTTPLAKLDLAKYPALKYAEHAVSTKKQREALAAAETARKEKEARDRQAALEAAAKAEDDALHADERKAEAARKAQQCASQHQSKCNADCQGNSACVKKCLQKMPACK